MASSILECTWNWRDRQLQTHFHRLLQEGSFVDVTLFCEGQSVKCHRVILAACSDYFEKLFKDSPEKNLVVSLAGVKYPVLEALLDLMYTGKVRINEKFRRDLLKTAAEWKIRDLVNSTNEQQERNVLEDESSVFGGDDENIEEDLVNDGHVEEDEMHVEEEVNAGNHCENTQDGIWNLLRNPVATMHCPRDAPLQHNKRKLTHDVKLEKIPKLLPLQNQTIPQKKFNFLNHPTRKAIVKQEPEITPSTQGSVVRSRRIANSSMQLEMEAIGTGVMLERTDILPQGESQAVDGVSMASTSICTNKPMKLENKTASPKETSESPIGARREAKMAIRQDARLRKIPGLPMSAAKRAVLRRKIMAKKLVDSGLKVAQAAAECEISITTLYRFLRKFKTVAVIENACVNQDATRHHPIVKPESVGKETDSDN